MCADTRKYYNYTNIFVLSIELNIPFHTKRLLVIEIHGYNMRIWIVYMKNIANEMQVDNEKIKYLIFSWCNLTHTSENIFRYIA